MDANKLAHMHRGIVKKNRLTAAELEEIKREIHAERNDRTTANVKQAEVAISPERYHQWFNESGDEQTFLGFDNSNTEENLEETHNPEERVRIMSLEDDILKE